MPACRVCTSRPGPGRARCPRSLHPPAPAPPSLPLPTSTALRPRASPQQRPRVTPIAVPLPPPEFDMTETIAPPAAPIAPEPLADEELVSFAPLYPLPRLELTAG